MPPRLCDEKACIETPELVVTTDPGAEPDLHCVLQEGLSMGGKPVWASAADLDSPARRILVARSTTTKLLEDEATFKTMIKIGLATDTLQLPSTLPFTMFKELEPKVADPGEFMDAAIEYVEYQRDAKDLLALAVYSRVNGAGSEAVQDYLDRSLLSVRGADKALQRMVPLLPA